MALDNPLVTVCVPVYNVECFIERCSRSLFEQSYHNLEYVIVDDCSPDRSISKLLHVLQDYPERKEQVVVLTHDRNRGLAAARNTAVSFAHGHFITHVDSDDWLSLDAVDVLVDGWKKSGADIVSGSMALEKSSGRTIIKTPVYLSKEDAVLDLFQLTFNHVLVHRLIRTSLYRDNNISAIEGLNVGEDHYTMPKLAYFSNGIHVVDKVIYHYDITNPQSYLHSGLRSEFDGNFNSFMVLFDYFSLLEEFYTRELKKIFAKFLKSFLRRGVISNDYTLYYDMLAKLRSCDKDVLSLAGYSTPIKRFVYSHPRIFRTLLHISWSVKRSPSN